MLARTTAGACLAYGVILAYHSENFLTAVTLFMRAVIPVAGVGSRLRPHTFTLPKVLLNVAGKPMLGHILDTVIGAGVTEATFVVGHMSDLIRQFVRTAYPDLRADFVEQEEQQGLGHAIYVARASLSEEPVLIILGDTIFDVDLAPVLR